MHVDTVLAEIHDRGYSVIEDFLPPATLAAVRDRLGALLGRHKGRNNFEGFATERVYTLVARDPLFAEIAIDPRIMALCDAILLPDCLLTASQAIVIAPGETPQPWHTDDSFYDIPRPRPMISLSTIVAVDDFTIENGATEIIPGSHLWGEARYQGAYRKGGTEEDPSYPDRLAGLGIPAEMPAGACLVFAGTLLHRGGANRSDGMRRAFSNQYCQPWARTQENFFLSIPPSRVAKMPDRLQSLLGYAIYPPFMGHVTARHPKRMFDPGFDPLADERD